MIELILISREKDRKVKGFETRRKKIKAWLTHEIDLETQQGLFEAAEKYQIEGTDKDLPKTILIVHHKNTYLINGWGIKIPSTIQLSKQIKKMISKLIDIIEKSAEKEGYKIGFLEADNLHKGK